MTRDDANFDPHVEPREIDSRDADDEQSAGEPRAGRNEAAGGIGGESTQRGPGPSPSDLRQGFTDPGERDTDDVGDAKGTGESANEEITRGDGPHEKQLVPMTPAELVELLASPHASAAIEALAKLAAPGGAAPISPVPDGAARPASASSPDAIAPPPAIPQLGQSTQHPVDDSERHGTVPPHGSGPIDKFAVSSQQNPAPRDVRHLAIEVEVNLANMERMTRIAIDESKEEFRRLAQVETDDLRHQFGQFQDEMRIAWGR